MRDTDATFWINLSRTNLNVSASDHQCELGKCDHEVNRTELDLDSVVDTLRSWRTDDESKDSVKRRRVYAVSFDDEEKNPPYDESAGYHRGRQVPYFLKYPL